MSIIGVDAVDAAVDRGQLVLRPRDRLTPLARDRVAELGLEIVQGAALTGDADAVDRSRVIPAVDLRGPGSLPSPPSPALFRRGAPGASIRGRRSGPRFVANTGRPRSARVGRVTVVGAGNVGTHTAMRLAEADLVDEIVLVDIVEGLAKGVALDLTHAAGLLGFSGRIRGAASVEAAGKADYTILTAGRPRQPGMTRTDLTATNAEIVGPVARAVGSTSPDGVIVVVTNPLDEMTELAWTVSGLPSARVVGMAGMLDAARFQALTGLAVGVRADEVHALALGSHGDEMVIPVSQATVGTLDVASSLGDALPDVVNRTRESGAEVVGLLGKGSAFITPGLAAARMVEHMIREEDSVVSATVRPDGEFGLSGVYVGLPVRLGRHGVTEIVEVSLSPAELSALRDASVQIRERVSTMASAVGA